MRLAAVAAALSLLTACGQKIVVHECDGDVSNPRDGGVVHRTDSGDRDPGDDAGAGSRDGGAGSPDGGAGQDGGGGQDGGSVGCPAGAPYCITALVPSVDQAEVRSPVTFTATLDDPGGAGPTFSVEPADVTTRRRAPLPDADLDDLELTLATDPDTGETTFTVAQVPTWFATTTFVIRLHAQAPGGPEVWAEASVTIRGNVLLSGSSSVYAVASDGRPALSENFTDGRLLDGNSFLRSPRDMLVARDGTLVVYDDGTTPPRLRRFELTGENRSLGDFDHEDDMGEALIRAGETAHGFTQLDDGRFVLVDYEFSSTPASRLVLWNEDGTYDRTLPAVDPDVRWTGVATGDPGEIVVLERDLEGRLLRIDADSGAEVGVIATDVAYGWNVARMPDGSWVAGTTGDVLRVTPQGGRVAANQLPGGSSDYWEFITPVGADGYLAARDRRGSNENVALIREDDFVRWYRQSSGSPYLLPVGMTLLE